MKSTTGRKSAEFRQLTWLPAFLAVEVGQWLSVRLIKGTSAMKNFAIGIALSLAAIFGGNYIGNALCGAVDAPRAAYDAAETARIERMRQEGAESIAREQAELERQLASIFAGLK
jgi:hypothetical protein